MTTVLRIAVVVVVIIVASAAAIYWLSDERPSERDRVHFPTGYSLCPPEHWSTDFSWTSRPQSLAGAPLQDELAIEPDRFAGAAPKLSVNHYSGTMNLKSLRDTGWADGMFQGQPALLLEKHRLMGFSRGVIFERGGQWFQLYEQLSVAESARKDVWWRFLETFRYPDGPIQPPPTRTTLPPSSMPASTTPFEFPSR